MHKHFVIFYSPGTFTSEVTEKEISSWDVDLAKQMARDVSERYDAKPYGFKFITKSRSEKELDSSVTAQSGMYYLGGKIKTLDDVKAENDPKNDILISNMVGNGYDRIIENNNSWKFTAPLRDDDTVLDWSA